MLIWSALLLIYGLFVPLFVCHQRFWITGKTGITCKKTVELLKSIVRLGRCTSMAIPKFVRKLGSS